MWSTDFSRETARKDYFKARISKNDFVLCPGLFSQVPDC